MPEAHLKNMFRTVVQQEGQLRTAVLRNIRLADTQRDTSNRQMKGIEQTVRRPFIGEFFGDKQGDASELIKQSLRRHLIIRTSGQRFER